MFQWRVQIEYLPLFYLLEIPIKRGAFLFLPIHIHLRGTIHAFFLFNNWNQKTISEFSDVKEIHCSTGIIFFCLDETSKIARGMAFMSKFLIAFKLCFLFQLILRYYNEIGMVGTGMIHHSFSRSSIAFLFLFFGLRISVICIYQYL